MKNKVKNLDEFIFEENRTKKVFKDTLTNFLNRELGGNTYKIDVGVHDDLFISNSQKNIPIGDRLHVKQKWENFSKKIIKFLKIISFNYEIENIDWRGVHLKLKR
jgi:hypothetical protein